MDDKSFIQLIEILKASVPIVALVAMFFTPFLTARYNRKQKIRDELFSYKIKAYMILYEIVYITRADFIKRTHDINNPDFYAVHNAFPQALQR